MPAFIKISLATIAAVFVGSLVPSAAQACGGFFCSQVPIDQTGENIIFVDSGSTIETHVQISFDGEADDFSWVVPVPGIPDLALGTEELFRTLLWSTRPTFSMTVGDHDCANPWVYENWDDDLDGDAASDGEGGGGGGGDVTILQQSQVGSYEATVVGATDAQALIDWFNCNGYRVAISALPRIEAYLAEGMDFLALKLTTGATTGDLMPLVMTYGGELPMIPIVLTAVASRPNLVVRAWFLSDRRAVPANYDHVQLNDARLQWGQGWWYGGTPDYDRLAARAVDEAGGHAFVTDYSGDAGFLYGMLYPATGYDLASLRIIDDPAQFMQRALQIGLPRNGVMQGIIRRHIPMPQELIDQGVTEQQFYNGISNYSSYLTDLEFDPIAFVAEIEELVVEPMERANELFADPSRRHLTRMTSLLSGWEMNEDPVFHWLPTQPIAPGPMTYPWLGDVAQDRSAPVDFIGGDEATQCWGVAQVVRTRAGPKPVLTFPWTEGIEFPTAEELPSCLDLPAALLVERFPLDGEPSIVLDNRAALAAMGPYCVVGTEPDLETEAPEGVAWPPDAELLPAEAIDPQVCDQLDDVGLEGQLNETPPPVTSPVACGMSGDFPRGAGAAALALLLGLPLALRRRRGRALPLAAAGLVATLLLLGGCAAPEAEAPSVAFAKVSAHEGVPAPEAADALVAAMARLGLDRAVLVPHARTPTAGTEEGLLLSAQHAPRLVTAGSVRPFAASAPEALAQATVDGVVAAKLALSGGASAGLERAELAAIVADCSATGMPLLLEVDLRPTTRQLQLEQLLTSWPDARFVLAHWGGLLYEADRLDGLLIRHPNLFVDTSTGGDGARFFTAASADPDTLGALLQRHHRRFLWGTGVTLVDPESVTEWEARVSRELVVYRDDFGLTQEALERILAGNAQELYPTR